MQIGTFKITAHSGGFDVVDTCDFNNWGVSMGHVTLANAEAYATWAHAFKTGRTFQSLASYAKPPVPKVRSSIAQSIRHQNGLD